MRYLYISTPSVTYTSKKNCKIVTKSGLDKSEKDEMSNATDKDTKEKELGTSNSSIKVHISHSSVLHNLFTLDSTK